MQPPPDATRLSDIPRYWATHTPSSPAIWESGSMITYAEFLTLILAGTELLRSRRVDPGDRVLIVAENCVAELALFFACCELRAWPIMVNARLSEREIEVIRSHSKPLVQLFTSSLSADAARHAARAGAAPLTNLSFAGIDIVCTDRRPALPTKKQVDQVAMLIYTSGTTGSPKAVMVTHRGLLHFCEVSRQVRGLVPADCIYGVLPFSHIFGIATIVLSTLYAGAQLYVESKFDPATTIRAIRDRQITALQGVPMMWRRLLAYKAGGAEWPALPSLRYLYVGGGGLEPNLKAEIESTFGLPVHHGYGMTEYAGSMFVTRPDAPRNDCSSGTINTGCEVRLLDEHGQDVPVDQPGDILIRGPGTMLGYYRAPAATREVLLSDGWLKTGDIGRMTADGALFVVGRRKEVIKRSGFNVYPVEVESVLNSHAAVKLSAVVGAPASDGNEEIIAFIELDPARTVTDSDLRVFTSERLAPYKRPTRYVRIASLPVNANGKVRKVELTTMLSSAPEP